MAVLLELLGIWVYAGVIFNLLATDLLFESAFAIRLYKSTFPTACPDFIHVAVPFFSGDLIKDVYARINEERSVLSSFVLLLFIRVHVVMTLRGNDQSYKGHG